MNSEIDSRAKRFEEEISIANTATLERRPATSRDANLMLDLIRSDGKMLASAERERLIPKMGYQRTSLKEAILSLKRWLVAQSTRILSAA